MSRSGLRRRAHQSLVVVSLWLSVFVCMTTSNLLLLEHVQRLLSQTQEVTNTSIAHYKMILRGIFDSIPIVPQTSKTSDGNPLTTLTSNYLCLQCPSTVTEEERLKHGNKKMHRFCMSWIHSVLGVVS